MTLLPDFITSPDNISHYVVPFILGVLAHVCCFRFGEWDLRTTQLLVALIAVQGLLGLFVWKSDVQGATTLYQSWKLAVQISFIFLAGTYSSMLNYRAFFHRLNRFPGPFASRLSNFNITRLSVKKFQLFQEVRQLHMKYGDIVRVGMCSVMIPGFGFEPTDIDVPRAL